MNSFIKFTRRGKRRETLKNMRPIWVSVNSVIAVQENPYGGAVLTCALGEFSDRVLYVTSSPEQVLAVMKKAAEESSAAYTPDGSFEPD